MLDLIGDVLYLDGDPVGLITIPNGTKRALVEEVLDPSWDIAVALETLDFMAGELDELMQLPVSSIDNFRERMLSCIKDVKGNLGHEDDDS